MKRDVESLGFDDPCLDDHVTVEAGYPWSYLKIVSGRQDVGRQRREPRRGHVKVELEQ